MQNYIVGDPVDTQQHKELHAFYRTRWTITVLTRARYWPHIWATVVIVASLGQWPNNISKYTTVVFFKIRGYLQHITIFRILSTLYNLRNLNSIIK
jgi:hypothetical protein